MRTKTNPKKDTMVIEHNMAIVLYRGSIFFFEFYVGWLGPPFLQNKSQAEAKTKLLGSIWILYPACPGALHFFVNFMWAGFGIHFCSTNPKQKPKQDFCEAFGFYTKPVQELCSFLWIFCELAWPPFLQHRSQAEAKPKLLGSIWILYPACPGALNLFVNFMWAGLGLHFCSTNPKQKLN